MLKKISIPIISIFILSIITSILMTILRKYFFEVGSYATTASFGLFLYYLVIIFAIQVLMCFWFPYLISEFLIKKGVKLFYVSIVTGIFTILIALILAYLRIQTYHFDPYKDTYQIWVFFMTGFLYPFISLFLKKKVFKVKE
jgi:hypothetical protein